VLKYTIGFIRQTDRVLLLNREKPSWMGCWNGVGGKLEPGETPRNSMLREMREETGLSFAGIGVEFKGVVTWTVEGKFVGGMYVFKAELSPDARYETPKKTDEGILDWKTVPWTLHPENRGVAQTIPQSIEAILDDPRCYEHRCYFENNRMARYERREIPPDVERIEDGHALQEALAGGFLRKGSSI